MKLGKRKRLTRLAVHEVSVVDRAAGEGTRVVLLKRNGKKKRRTGFTEAGELVDKGTTIFRTADGQTWDLPQGGALTEILLANSEALGLEEVELIDDGPTDLDAAGRAMEDDVAKAASLSRALEEIKEHRAFAKTIVMKEQEMTQPVDITKAAAVAVIKRFDDRVDQIAKRHNLTRGAALLKIASSRDDAALWRSYREAQQIAGAQFTPTPEPARVMVSPAFARMQKKAAKLAAKEGISEASAFSKIYEQRPDLAAEDRQFHFAKASGAYTGPAPADPQELMIWTIMQVTGVGRAEATRLAAKVRSGKPPKELLYPPPAAA